MMLSTREQIDLIKKIEEQVSSLGDYLYADKDPHINASIKSIEASLVVLRTSFYDKNTYIALKDTETGKITKKYFEANDIGAVCHYASQLYCFDDIDDTYSITEIVCGGRRLEYVGWQPGMLFEFRYVDTKEIIYSAEFPNWEH